jgi:hypothetical protein
MVCLYCAAFGQDRFGRISSSDTTNPAKKARQEQQLGVENSNNGNLCAAEEPSWPVIFNDSGHHGLQTLPRNRKEECAFATPRL